MTLFEGGDVFYSDMVAGSIRGRLISTYEIFKLVEGHLNGRWGVSSQALIVHNLCAILSQSKTGFILSIHDHPSQKDGQLWIVTSVQEDCNDSSSPPLLRRKTYVMIPLEFPVLSENFF